MSAFVYAGGDILLGTRSLPEYSSGCARGTTPVGPTAVGPTNWASRPTPTLQRKKRQPASKKKVAYEIGIRGRVLCVPRLAECNLPGTSVRSPSIIGASQARRHRSIARGGIVSHPPSYVRSNLRCATCSVVRDACRLRQGADLRVPSVMENQPIWKRLAPENLIAKARPRLTGCRGCRRSKRLSGNRP